LSRKSAEVALVRVGSRTNSLHEVARRSSCASRVVRPPAGERSECEPKHRIVGLTVRSDHESSTASAAVGAPTSGAAGVGRTPGARAASEHPKGWTEGSTPDRIAPCHGGASRPAGTGLPARSAWNRSDAKPRPRRGSHRCHEVRSARLAVIGLAALQRAVHEEQAARLGVSARHPESPTLTSARPAKSCRNRRS
jgi:hypothetical protein